MFEWPYSGQISLYIFGHFVSIILMTGIAIYAWRTRDSDEALTLSILTSGTSLWCSTNVIQILTTSYIAARTARQVGYMGVTTVMAGWLAFALAFTSRTDFLTRKSAVALSIEPVLFTLLGLTNDPFIFELLGGSSPDFGHYLIWSEIGPGDSIWTIDADWGIGWYIHALYSYSLIAAGLLLVIPHFIRHQSIYRSQGVAVLIAGLVPAGVNVLNTLGVTELDYTPLAFGIAGGAFFWAIFRYNLTEITPIARQTAWDELGDAVITLDEEDRVVDANESARELFDIQRGYQGMASIEFFDTVPNEVLRRLADTNDLDTELTTQIDGEPRHFSLSISPLDEHREKGGRVFVLQDITPLKRREQELDVLRQVQSRVLRHNIRTELTMVRGHAELLADDDDEVEQQRLQSIKNAENRLTTISDKAQTIEELFEEEQAPREYDLRGCADRAVTNVRAEYPELSVSVTGAERCPVTASPQLQTVIENLLENAAVHNTNPNPQATVHVVNGSEKRVTVSDNGPGIPEQEITVLEKGREDALEHGSGLGLWLVKWIADRSGATLEFETGEDGTAVSLQFT